MDISKYRDNIELSDICVIVEDHEFNFHKFPLSINCEYFKNECKNKNKITLQNFPAGKANFEMIADHCYGKDVEIKIENVISIFCGSHYLGMFGSNNLIEKSQKFIDRIFRSSEYSRSIDDIVTLLDSCKEMENELLKQFIERGFVTILQLWLRPLPGFKSSHKETYIEDSVIFDRILNLNHHWMEKFLEFCKNDEFKYPYIGKLVVHYIEKKLLVPEKKKCKKTKEAVNNKEVSHRSSSSSSNDVNTDESNSEISEIDYSKKRKKKRKIKNKPLNHNANEDQGQYFDNIINILPNEINMGKIITTEWLKTVLDFCDKYGCKSRTKLLQHCGSILTNSLPEQVKLLNPKVVKEMIKQTINNDQIDKELMKWIWDNYFLEMAQNAELDPVIFNKVVKNMPESHDVNPDIVFKIVLSMLNNGVSQTQNNKNELINSVQLEKISPDNLEAAIESRFWDIEIICKVAIKRLKDKEKTSTEKYLLKDMKDNFESVVDSEIDTSPTYGNGNNIKLSFRNHSYTSRTCSFPNLIDDEIYSNSQEFRYCCYPTTKYMYKCYSPITYLTLEENLKYELKKISDSYTNYYRKRLRSRPRRKYPLTYHFQK